MYYYYSKFIKAPWLFGFVFLIYVSNFKTSIIPDTEPTSLAFFNLFSNHTFYFDSLCLTTNQILQKNFIGTVLSTGHIGVFHPIGMTILTLPLYLIYTLFLFLIDQPIDLLAAEFEKQRIVSEKLISCICAAMSVQLFALALSKRFDSKTSLVTVLAYALCTGMWTVCGTNLWQHTGINLLIVCAFFVILSDNNTSKKYLSFLIGLIIGFLPFIRPTAAVFSLAINFSLKPFDLYRIIGIVIGALPGLAWNFYFFNHPIGGYYTLFADSLNTADYQSMLENALGLLFDPFRGLLFFSPFLIFALVGAKICFFHEKNFVFRRLLILLFIACIVTFIYYSQNLYWQGGFVYGPRYLLDLMPCLIFLLAYFVQYLLDKRHFIARRFCIIIFSITLVWSFALQFIGAYGTNWPRWKSHPYSEAAWNYLPAGAPAPYIGPPLAELCMTAKISEITKSK
jgi:hypothetical protein